MDQHFCEMNSIEIVGMRTGEWHINQDVFNCYVKYFRYLFYLIGSPIECLDINIADCTSQQVFAAFIHSLSVGYSI